MGVRLSVLMILSPLIVFTVAVLVVAIEQAWQSRGRLKKGGYIDKLSGRF